jgi:hypothetical protein
LHHQQQQSHPSGEEEKVEDFELYTLHHRDPPASANVRKVICCCQPIKIN